MIRYWAPKSIKVATWEQPSGPWKMTAQPSQKLTARQTPGMVQLQERFFVNSHFVANLFFASVFCSIFLCLSVIVARNMLCFMESFGTPEPFVCALYAFVP